MFTYSLAGLRLQVAAAEPEEVEESETTARSAVYKLLGELFAPPQEGLLEKLGDGRFAAALQEAVAMLPYGLVLGGLPLPEAADVHGLAEQYASYFGVRAGRSMLCEGRDDGEAKLRREYAYFGLASGGSDDAESRPADHLATQCEFMQYLTFREAATDAERLRFTYRTAQRDFLERHMLAWVPGMAEEALGQGPPEPYAWGLVGIVELLGADHGYVAGLLVS